jgi:glycosyltransferase involved in cell wall biosynthesis
MACEILLHSKLNDDFKLIHLDLSDHRNIDTLAKIDFINSYLAIKQYVKMIGLIIQYRPTLVYIPAGQTTVGYIRDAGYILIAKFFGRKVITHLRGGYFRKWYESSGSLLQWFIRFVHKKVDAQIVLGNNLRSLYNWLLPEEKIFVVPNGGNFLVGSSMNTNEKVTVLFLGNYVKSKGVLEVLYAVPQVCKQLENVRFVFAGEWFDEEVKSRFLEFMKQYPDLPIINYGLVKGEMKKQLLMESDIFVFPTYYRNEGHPWVIIEAMAAGLPIISTDHAAISESVINGVNGFLVEKENVNQLADKIISLVADPVLRTQMGTAGKKMYLDNFTEDKMIERMSSVFKTVIGS